MDKLKEETAAQSNSPIDIPKLARVVFKYDPNSVLHGVFIAKKELGGGRLRMQRIVSAFIEAENVRPAESGGVKMDRVDPTGDTQKGFGHVPFHRTEYVAEAIKAYFSLDLATLRTYALGEDAENLLISLALWKIHRLLSRNMRLRTACDLEVGKIVVTKPEGYAIPDETVLLEAIRSGIQACADMFSTPPITEVTWS